MATLIKCSAARSLASARSRKTPASRRNPALGCPAERGSARFAGKALDTWLGETIISSKDQIVLPVAFRKPGPIEAGQQFEVEGLDRGDYRLVRHTARPNEGVVDWLLACPEKGFFVPIESESADTRSFRNHAGRQPSQDC